MQNKVDLKKHNLETYNIIKETYKERNHIGVVQATGTGKSFLIAKCIEDMDFKKVLFLTPSLHIINEFKSNFKFLKGKIEFLTYKKLTFIKDLKQYLEENEYDFIILDEYHRCGAKTWNIPVKYILSYYKDKKVLGVTATPVRYLDNSRDMTIELFNSKPIIEMSLLSAIEDKVLPKPKYVLSYYNIKDELDKIKLNEKNAIDKDIVKNMSYIINNINLLSNIEDVLSKNITKERKFIVFCSNVNHLKEMSNIVPKWFNNIGFKTEEFYIYSDTDNNKCYYNAEEELDKFKNSKVKDNKVQLLFVINILNEGVHINDVDGLIFLRKTISPIILYQQLGRALKSGSDKTPIVFDFVNNINKLTFNATKIEYTSKIKNINFMNLDYTLNGEIEVIDYISQINELLMNLDELSSLSSWKSFINSLIEYKNENNNCNIPSGHPLYKRCLSIRKQYQNGILDKHKINELNSIGFGWDINIYNDNLWNRMFNKLLDFKEEFKHVNVPRSYKDKELATWVHTQRKYKDTMPQERKEKLISVGFEFELAKKRNEEEWNEMLNKLLNFKAKFNHVNVSSRYEDKKLANWVNSQRKSYKAGKLSDIRYSKLLEIGFKFPEKSI